MGNKADKDKKRVAQYVWLMRFLGFMYAFAGCLFFLAPKTIFRAMNFLPTTFEIGTAIPESSEHFWLVLAASLMAALASLSFLASESPKTRGYALVHVLAKTVSAAGFFYMYTNFEPYLAYLIGMAVDIPIAILVATFIARVTRAHHRTL